MQKMRFRISHEDWPGIEAENLWVDELVDGHFKINSIPFYVYGVSTGDVVAATMVNGRLEFDSVVSRSGHSTYRVLIANEQGPESPAFAFLWQRLAALGCSNEVAKRRWVAIDIPATTNADSVYGILEVGAHEGVWTFDEGHCGHPL
jgi:hypothetical protein